MKPGLTALAGNFAICRLPPAAAVPDWLPARGLTSCTRTLGELSVVCEEGAVPREVRAEPGWRALLVDGPLDLGAVGILAGLTTVLANAGVSVFVVSTFDTDCLLVRVRQYDAAVGALRAAGHAVSDS